MAKYKPRRVTSEDERFSGGGQYMTLASEGEKFLGYALFEANPAVDEPGYYEYMEHWVQNGAKGSSVPCAGEDCPLCEEGERPRNRAKTLWLVLEDQKGSKLDPPELRIFNLNGKLIKQFTDFRSEDEKIKGRKFRVTRSDDSGNYTLMPKTDFLKIAQVKEHLKGKDAPDIESMVTSQLNKAMEGLATARAMADDDVDETPEPQKGKGKSSAKGKAEPKKKDKEDWPEEADEITVTVVSTDDDDNTMVVTSEEYEDEATVWGTPDIDLTELEEDAEITISYVTDKDDDKVITSLEEAEGEGGTVDDEEEDELPDKIEGEEFTVLAVDGNEYTIDVENDEMKFQLYIIDSMKIDFDDYEPGTKIIVNAEKDTSNDLVATEIPEIVKKSGAKKTGGRKKSSGKGKN